MKNLNKTKITQGSGFIIIGEPYFSWNHVKTYPIRYFSIVTQTTEYSTSSLSQDSSITNNLSLNNSNDITGIRGSNNPSITANYIVGFTDGVQLVVWGVNLTSNVGYPKFTKLVSYIVKLPSYYKGIIVGLILSDGWLTFASSTHKNARLGFQQSLAHFPYFWFVFIILSHYCSSYPHTKSGIRAGKRFFGIGFFTRSLPCFTELHSYFYDALGKKVIPVCQIYDLLTPVALAHWIIGDGSVSRHGIILCTESFTIQEVTLLLNVLMERYGLECTLHPRGNSYRIYIRESSMPLLRSIVSPFMCSSMLYKLKVNSQNS